MIVVGVDPGAGTTGYGVVAHRGGAVSLLECGVIRTDTDTLDWTLALDGQTLSGTIALHIFAGIKGVDPFNADSKPVDTFRFTAQRVTAP